MSDREKKAFVTNIFFSACRNSPNCSTPSVVDLTITSTFSGGIVRSSLGSGLQSSSKHSNTQLPYTLCGSMCCTCLNSVIAYEISQEGYLTPDYSQGKNDS